MVVAACLKVMEQGARDVWLYSPVVLFILPHEGSGREGGRGRRRDDERRSPRAEKASGSGGRRYKQEEAMWEGSGYGEEGAEEKEGDER